MLRDHRFPGARVLPLIGALLTLALSSSPGRSEDYDLTFPQDFGPQLLQVTILADSAATGSVDVPGLSLFQPFTIAAGSFQIFTFPAGASVVGSDVTVDRAVHVSSDVPVHVIAFSSVSPGTEDAFQVLERSRLGTDYVAVTYPAEIGFANEFAIVAPYPGTTTVTITPSDVNDSGLTPGVPYQRVLSQGDVYQLQSSIDNADLSGTLISADQPVAVFSGNRLAFVPAGTSYGDYLMTQLLPVTLWGDAFIVARTQLHLVDRLLIQAQSDGTLITSSDGLNIMLNAGGSYEHAFSANAISIAASGPIQVTQVTAGQLADPTTNADPAMAAVMPRSAWEGIHRVHLPDPTSGHTFRIAVVAPCTSAGFIEIDGVPIPGGQFAAVPSSDACFAISTVSVGAHTITGPDSFGVLAYGYDAGQAYAYQSYGVPGSAPPAPGPYPWITSITDVPNDQGRRVRIEWDAAPQDDPLNPEPVTGYAIFRRHDPGLAPSLAVRPPLPLAVMADWDYVTTVPAFAEESYATLVETLADSTISNGPYESVFFVRGMTVTPSVYYDSPPDSGHSVDNLAPSAPQSFSAVHATGSGNQLAWDPPQDADFMQHRIYRGATPDFVATPANRVAVIVGQQWTDPDHDGWDVFYKVTTVDFSGNESTPADETGTTAVDPNGPLRTRLRSAAPNPFRGFDLAREAYVRLTIYDVRGRRVAGLASRVMPAGRHDLGWNGADSGGHRLRGGTYFIRFEADGVLETRRLVKLE